MPLFLTLRRCSLLLVTLLSCSARDERTAPTAGTENEPMLSGPLLPASGAMCTLPGSVGAAECDDCVSRSCCAEVDACVADASCSSLFDCLFACDGADSECPRRCLASPERPAAFTAFQDCKRLSCES
ncbi:MAG: hypothetical protein RL033_1010, partial [Pseudomonadota bacterium]